MLKITPPKNLCACMYVSNSLHSSQVGGQTATGVNKCREVKGDIRNQMGRCRSMQMISVSKAVALKRSSLQ